MAAVRLVRYSHTTTDLEGEINATLKKCKGTLVSVSRDGIYYLVAIETSSKVILP